MKAISLTILFVVALLSFREGRAQWIRLDNDTIKLDGDIDRDSYKSYLDTAKGGYSKVILQSAGGSPKPALLIALDMQQHHPVVVVESHCLSACANYLLLASPVPVVKCGALVIWHGSPSGGFSSIIESMRAEGKNEKLIARYVAWSKQFESMESTYFSRIGIDRNLLFDSVKIVTREHVAPEATFTFDEMTGDYSETVSSGLWIPTRKVIRQYGIDTKGFCSSYDLDIPRNLRRLEINAPYTTHGR